MKQCGRNVVEHGRTQMTIWHMHIAGWIRKGTNPSSEYVILIAFPLQQWLHERTSVLRYTCIYCLAETFSFQGASINRLTPNDPYMGRTAPLSSKRCILHIYSTNVGTEYFKHDLYSPFFSLQNAVFFLMLTSLVPVLFTFYIQSVLKLKK